MEFWKMNGAGNDFIIINNIKEQLSAEQLSECARILCKRHMSIGADGFIFPLELFFEQTINEQRQKTD